MPVPVSDVERAKAFYADQVGFTVDLDFSHGDSFRVVQLSQPAPPALPAPPVPKIRKTFFIAKDVRTDSTLSLRQEKILPNLVGRLGLR